MQSRNNTKKSARSQGLARAEALGLLGFALIFSGCTTLGPDFQTPESKVQEEWMEAEDAQVKSEAVDYSQWWTIFEDPVLDDLVQQAYQQNLPLQVAGLRILEARAQLGIAIGEQYPQTQDTFGSGTAARISENAPNAAGSENSFFNYEVGFDAAWELDFWGRFRRNVESADAILNASVADYDDGLVSLTAEVARVYVAIRTFEELIALALKNVKIQERSLQIATVRFRNGATTELDVTQSQTLLSETQASVPRLEAGLRQAENALSILLGEPPGAVRMMLKGEPMIPIAPAEVAIGMPADLLRRRPDIRSAELNAAAQSARIGAAQAELYPSFSLVGSFGMQTSSGGGRQSNRADFNDLFTGDSFFYSVGPGFSWPIFNYGRLRNNVRVQDARLQQLIVTYQDAVINAAREVEDGLVGFLKAQQETEFLQVAVQAAQRSTELSITQYRDGAVDFQRVLDSERTLVATENTFTTARSAIATNLIAVYKAIGGGWELRQGQPIVPETTQETMSERTNWGRLIPPPPAPEEVTNPPPARELPLFQKPDW